MSEPIHPTTENDTEAWTYAPSLSDAPKHTIYGPRGEVFATVYRSKDRARLVAAAPDMLDALRAAEEALASCYQVCDYPANGKSTQDYALRDVRDAIAKAAGGSHV